MKLIQIQKEYLVIIGEHTVKVTIHTKQQKLTTEEIKKLKKTLKESLLVL